MSLIEPTEFYKRTSKLNEMGDTIFKDIPKKILFEMFVNNYQLARDFEDNGRSSEVFQTRAYELALWFLKQDFHQYRKDIDGKS